ncbi:MAG: envelope stress response membrane protein PspC [Idiomarina sp.]|jgi:phage shock protein C|uniref:Phage shock protein C (PspC) family protein n=1 Tax=Idiomarina aquatica TaxID=1327752 RepID=A0A4R6PRI6_9GAMM|nr:MULTISPECIES: envelope stress response membrane protein PspC [Idiomarina]MBT42929.1 envelope stress response membrane protein PspC [Idiomarina sp.]TDP40554.1 phage shock protein C (PspC) family protein [Idiomarina aquatica]
MTSIKRELCRNTEKGKLAGVCAGLADYLNIEAWIVRVVFFTGLIFSSGFFFILYVAGWLILDKKPTQPHHMNVKTGVYQAGEPPHRAFRELNTELEELEHTLQKMERYVTSEQYNLHREFSKL